MAKATDPTTGERALTCDRCASVSSPHDADHVRNAWSEMKVDSGPWRDLCPHCGLALGEWFKRIELKA